MIGFAAGACGASQDYTVLIGSQAGGCACGTNNVAIGYRSLQKACCAPAPGSGGIYCAGEAIAIGTFSAGNSARIVEGIYIGHYAGYYNGQANCCARANIMIGYKAGYCQGKGDCNVYIGPFAALGASGVTDEFASRNVAIGGCAGAMIGKEVALDNVLIGYKAGFCSASAFWCGGCQNTMIGACTEVGQGCCNNIVIGTCMKASIGGSFYSNLTVIGTCGGGTAAGCIRVCGCLAKGSGSFMIDHPNPEKKGKQYLHHSYVEAPTRGDNLYRWSIQTNDCQYSIKLPNYFKYLNENSTINISSVGHFGKAYGKISEDGEFLNICSNQDGKYNVLTMGTRCDPLALRGWFGVETDMNKNDAENCSKGCFYGYK
tara:strand:- start:311 stop:1429 length:1119 start_codon:yes stop_codon:yes gene_type:complete